MMECAHAETCVPLIDTCLAGNEEEKHWLFSSVETIPAIKRKAEWAPRWCDPKQCTFAEQMIAFAAVEGMFFSTSFCAIFFLKQRGMLPGLCQSNALISHDEGMHTDFACLIHTLLICPAAPLMIRSIVTDVVETECKFAHEALPIGLTGMNATLMSQCVEFCADRLLAALDQPKKHDSKKPFPFMKMIGLQDKSNFFEKKVSEHVLSGVGNHGPATNLMSSFWLPH